MLPVSLLVTFLGLIFSPWEFLEGKDWGPAPAGLVSPIAILLPFICHFFFAASLTAVFPFSLPPSFSLPRSLFSSSSSSPLSLLETRS